MYKSCYIGTYIASLYTWSQGIKQMITRLWDEFYFPTMIGATCTALRNEVNPQVAQASRKL